MTKRPYVAALVCYLAIPAVVIAGGVLHRLIDPEMARFTADYARNFQLLQLVAMGAMAAAAAFALVLWAAACYLVLKARQRSPLWLALAAAGPFGFMFIAMLADRAPAPDDRYQHFIRTLKWYWRAPLEIAVFIAAWFLAYQCVALKRDLSIRYESYSTGTPVETIVERHTASSGMYAFGEGLETMYLVPLFYLLWPMFFNLVGQRFKRRPYPA